MSYTLIDKLKGNELKGLYIGAILVIILIATPLLYPKDYREMLEKNPDASYILLESEDIYNVLTRGADDYIRWKFDHDENTIYLGRNKGAVEKWYVEYKRTYLPLNTVSDTSICSRTTATRCYVDNYYERLWRKASLISMNYFNGSNSITITKNTPYYGYGKRVGSGGTLHQFVTIDDDASYINFPSRYVTVFSPSSTRLSATNRLIWQVKKLPVERDYTGKSPCLLSFSNNIKIDLCDDIDKVDYYSLDSDKSTLEVFFKPAVGMQELGVRVYDPPNQSTPFLNTTYGTNTSVENLIAHNLSSGDTSTNIYRWQDNFTNTMLLNYAFDVDYSNHTLSNFTKDYSGSNKNGSCGWGNGTGTPTWLSEGKIGGAYQFDGTNDFMDIESGIILKSAFTIDFWANFTKSIKNETVFSSCNDPSGFCSEGNFDFLSVRKTGNNKIKFETAYHKSGNGSCVYETITNITTGEWVHLAITYDPDDDASGTKIYINGVNITKTRTCNGTFTNITLLPSIGARAIGNNVITSHDNYFNGSIDEFKIWNRSLSSHQIALIYTERTNEISKRETSIGDIWRVYITPVNTTEDGVELSSNNLTIIESYIGFDLTYPPNVTQFNVTTTSWYGWFTPQGQNRTYGVFNITNEGSSYIDLWFKINNTIDDVRICMDDDPGRYYCQNITNSSFTRLHNATPLNHSQRFWAWVFLDYPVDINVLHNINFTVNATPSEA